MLVLELYACNIFDHFHQTVDCRQLIRPQVQRLFDVAVHDLVDSLNTVIDVHKATGLLAVAPDLNLVLTRLDSANDLTANCRRRLLAATVPCSMWTIHIVEPSDARRKSIVLTEMATHPFRE